MVTAHREPGDNFIEDEGGDVREGHGTDCCEAVTRIMRAVTVSPDTLHVNILSNSVI